MRRFATLCFLLLLAGGCATATNDAATSGVITCISGSDCDEKWSRAMQWLQKNSSSKVTVTDTKLTTEDSPDALKPAFEVTKAAQEDKQRFQITMRAWCTAGSCEDLVAKLNTSFNDYVLGR